MKDSTSSRINTTTRVRVPNTWMGFVGALKRSEKERTKSTEKFRWRQMSQKASEKRNRLMSKGSAFKLRNGS